MQGVAQFNAIGTFYKQTKKETFFTDITNAAGTGWFNNNSDTFNDGGGVFTGLSAGCACIYASSGGIQSLPVILDVFAPPAPAPVCPPCPTLAPTPTPTPTKKPHSASTPTAPGPDATTSGVMLWSARTNAPVVAMAAGPSGQLYYLSADGYLYALSPDGRELFRRRAAGRSLLVGSGGTVYYLTQSGFLAAMAPDGVRQWKLRVGKGAGPLGLASEGSAIYGGADRGLFSAGSDGRLNWHVSFPGLRTLAVSRDGGLVAENRDQAVAFSADGSEGWSASPWSASPSGGIAVSGDVVYVGAGDGLYALSLAEGKLLWRYGLPSGVSAGPVAGSDGAVYFGFAGGLEARESDGSLLWVQKGLQLAEKTPLIPGHGGTVVVGDYNRAAFMERDGTFRWVGARFPGISAMVLSEGGILYIGTKSDRIYAIR